jgi:alpha-ketoglutaric semialdehyde dehydrogenase
MERFTDATQDQIDEVLNMAWQAFPIYRKKSLKQRADFMRCVATSINDISNELIPVAMGETNLGEARLRGELARTIFQLNSYAAACESGQWLEARIDTADKNRNPPKPDLRKMLIPLGPVVVFGASNFPFAYSTAGGDTACALAAGCPVVVKAHPAHPKTSELVAGAIFSAVAICNMPPGVFAHVHGVGTETGKALVMHPFTKAVGFTGSFAGGKALFDWGNQRQEPIPVFAEMGSVNPVFLLPGKLACEGADIAKMYAASITLSVGQFCTNPGILVAIEGEALNKFLDALAIEIEAVPPAKMLHSGIAKAFTENRKAMLSDPNVSTVAVSSKEADETQGAATIASTTAISFLNNQRLHQEVFGPYSLVVKCKDLHEMVAVAKQIEGQLTATIVATDEEIVENQDLIENIKNKCGRIILNGVPTGVEVCLAMNHSGPFPACTDARFTSVGADGIKRFARPMAFQNWSLPRLPDELKDENPLLIWRTVNDELTKNPI